MKQMRLKPSIKIKLPKHKLVHKIKRFKRQSSVNKNCANCKYRCRINHDYEDADNQSMLICELKNKTIGTQYDATKEICGGYKKEVYAR